MSNLTLLVAKIDNATIVVSGFVVFVVLALLFGKWLYNRNFKLEPKDLQEELHKIDIKAQAKEAGRVIVIEEKVSAALKSPGLDQTEDLLGEALSKARKTK